jgi:peptide deformylase
MVAKKLLTIPKDAAILRRICAPVPEDNRNLAKEIIEQLEETLANLPKNLNGVGLAAPQIGIAYKVFIIRLPNYNLTLINPFLAKVRNMHSVREGCLSIPGKTFQLYRPQIIKVKGLLLDGSIQTIRERGILAQIIQHEYDHLDGILIDRKGVEVHDGCKASR